MAFFNTTDSGLFQSAIRDARPILVSGPRSCGLSLWVEEQVASLARDSRFFELKWHRSIQELISALTSYCKTSVSSDQPERLSSLLDALSKGDEVVVFRNCHLADRDTVRWLLRATLADGVGSAGRIRFIMEGALNFDDEIEEEFSTGLPRTPLVQHVEPCTPWRTLAEIESIAQKVFPAHLPTLIPWIADVTGGDRGLVVDLFERIPAVSLVDETTLDAAFQRTIRQSTRANEIRDFAHNSSNETKELLRRMLDGEVFWGEHPRLLQDANTKKLYLAGIANYDVIVRGYCIKSRIVREVLANALEYKSKVEQESVICRTLHLIGYVAAVELFLQAMLARYDVKQLAGEASTTTPFLGLADKVMSSIGRDEQSVFQGIAECDSKKVLGRLAKIIRETIPEKKPLLEAVCERLGLPEVESDGQVLKGLTFTELSNLASRAGLVDKVVQEALPRIVGTRNNLAHLRAVTHEELQAVVTSVSHVLRALTAKLHTSSTGGK